jgi:hypothetical protein
MLVMPQTNVPGMNREPIAFTVLGGGTEAIAAILSEEQIDTVARIMSPSASFEAATLGRLALRKVDLVESGPQAAGQLLCIVARPKCRKKRCGWSLSMWL